MMDESIATARADIEATGDLLERALKLSDFKVLSQLKVLRKELSDALA